MTVFAHSQTTNKLVNANDSAQVSGKDRKIPPALGTNQIAGFGGFRSLGSLEKSKHTLYNTMNHELQWLASNKLSLNLIINKTHYGVKSRKEKIIA